MQTTPPPLSPPKQEEEEEEDEEEVEKGIAQTWEGFTDYKAKKCFIFAQK